MSTFAFVGDPEQGGLPRGSAVRIEEATDQTLVYEGKVSGSAHIELDPGKYVYSVVRLTTDKKHRRLDDVRYTGEFYHEITEPAYKQLRNLAPRLCRVLNTSEGARWRCLVTGCEDEFTTPLAMVIHENVDHIGIDREAFLADPLKASRSMGGRRMEKLAQEVASKKNHVPRKAVILGADLSDEESNEE